MPNRLSTCLSVFWLPVCLSVCLSVYLPSNVLCLSIWLSSFQGLEGGSRSRVPALFLQESRIPHSSYINIPHPVPKFGESRFTGASSQIPNPAPFFSKFPDPENTLPDTVAICLPVLSARVCRSVHPFDCLSIYLFNWACFSSCLHVQLFAYLCFVSLFVMENNTYWRCTGILKNTDINHAHSNIYLTAVIDWPLSHRAPKEPLDGGVIELLAPHVKEGGCMFKGVSHNEGEIFSSGCRKW